MEQILNGMKEICQTINRSETTVLSYKRKYSSFPIRKLNGGWISEREALLFWWREFISGNVLPVAIQEIKHHDIDLKLRESQEKWKKPKKKKKKILDNQ